MRKIVVGLIILLNIFGFCLGATTLSKNILVKINGKSYSVKDFQIWWRYWKDKNTPFPKTLKPFINWILLSDEAKAMGLDEEPSYKKKLNIFLEVRSLLQLRYDEVEKKININPDTLWEYYKKEFAPFYSIKLLITDNKTEAFLWKSKLKSKKDFDNLFYKLKKTGKARDIGWQRPINIPKPFKKIVFSAKKNKIYGPIIYKNNFYFLVVEDLFAGTKKDYKKIHQKVAYYYRKYMEDKLTEELINRLKEKYQVEVNWNLINKIKPFDNLSTSISKSYVLRVADKKLSAEQFKKDLEREIKNRRLEKKLNKDLLKKIKKNIVESIISQTLTSMEGLNRHYEKTVMKDIFWFYKRNRLIKEFENKIIKPKIKISEKEIKDYYKSHLKDFTTPEMVQIAVIQSHDEKLVRNAYSRIKKGEDFFDVAKEIQFHGARPEYRRLDNLVKEVRDVVIKLKPGEISPIIKYKDWFFIVKLIKRQKKKPHKLSQVKKFIVSSIYNKKFKELEDHYLQQLRKKSVIEINEDAWKKLKKNLAK